MATRQHGVISIAQLLEAGLNRNAVGYRTQLGVLHRIHRGVYAVGHPAISIEGRWMAAVLACGGPLTQAGQSSVLGHWRAARSHRSASALWGLLDPASGAVEVTIPGDMGRSRRRGIRLHRSTTLAAADVTIRRGIPVTKPSRTIRDLKRLASSSSAGAAIATADLRRAIRQAEVLGLDTGPATGDGTRSELERRFLTLCRTEGIPPPELNVRVHGFEVDFLWRAAKLVVETDGYRFHRGRSAFESDRARDLTLRGAGLAVIRLSQRQIAEEPRQVAEILRKLIADGRSAAD